MDTSPIKSFPVVGIGASAGGLEALKALLLQLPPEPGMAFVLIQHLDPRHASALVEILGRDTAMTVLNARHGEPVRPNHLYVIQPGSALEIAGDKFVVTLRTAAERPDFLVDRFFRSLAREVQARAIAVILSGSGSDGALGACEVKAAGGVAIAQDEASAGHGGMPYAAAHSGCVDLIMPPAEIAACLVRLGANHYSASAELQTESLEADYVAVIAHVREMTGVDFSLYRASMIRRRILRRSMLFGHTSIAPYVTQLRNESAEVQALYHDLLINVTSFFRDPALFETLATTVVPAILDAKVDDAPVRLWVAGCSTGQEAYSLAMVLLECLDDQHQRRIQIFATDLGNEEILARARAGTYPESIESDVSPARLERFFDKTDHRYRIKKHVRDLCVFAQQNITADPPFSHMDIITCRNVLIYMSPALQQRVIPMFHFALNLPGYLVLGSSETVGPLGDHFDMIDRASRIYRKKPAPLAAGDLQGAPDARAHRAGRRNLDAAPMPGDFHREADRFLLARYAPPGVLVDDELNILEFRGRTARYLETPAGQPTTSLLKLADDGLVLAVREALREARTTGLPVVRRGVRTRAGGKTHEISLEVSPVAAAGTRNRCYLVMFNDAEAAPAGSLAAYPRAPGGVRGWLQRWRHPPQSTPADAADSAEMIRLRDEHAATKEFLQSLLSERDASNEELRAANEEVMSGNEELQSTNEELETAKEELQAVNEELITVNEQLNSRNDELTQSNNDFSNLLSSSNIPLVAVGGDLCIRFYTMPAGAKMNLLPTDVGRPIGHIRPAIAVNDLEALVRGVIESRQPLQQEVLDSEERWHSLRIYPYRAAHEHVEGAVIVLVDVDDLRRNDALAQQTALLKEADQRKNEFLAMLGHELRNPLGPMANVAQILRLQGAAPQQREDALGVLDRQLAQLTRIVEDLLDATRISQGKIELRRERLDVNALIRGAIETSMPLIKTAGHRLETDFCGQPLQVYADPMRLTQVLVNLLNNAAKFTPNNGKIEIACHPAAEPASHAEICVRDSGIGMTPELRAHVFDLFMQADTYENRRHGGLGIGLTLARRLVEMHGGAIEARSDGEGQGSEFIVRLPLATDATPPAPRKRDSSDFVPVAPCRILIIEDNIDQAESLAALLQLWGYEAQTANEGTAGIVVAETFRPDVVLVDLGLPGISGYEVARRLRAHPELKNVWIVAQTGWGDTTDRRRTSAAGFDHHLLKPLDPEELRAVIARKRSA